MAASGFVPNREVTLNLFQKLSCLKSCSRDWVVCSNQARGVIPKKIKTAVQTYCKITSLQLDYTVQDVIVFKGERIVVNVPRGLKQRLVGKTHASYQGTQGYLLSGHLGMQGTHQGGPGQPRRTALEMVIFIQSRLHRRTFCTRLCNGLTDTSVAYLFFRL